MANLSGKTFEVQILDGGRWTTVAVHVGRSPALTQAEQLADSGKYRAVQVLSDSDRVGTEVIFEKTIDTEDEKPITVVPIRTAPVCLDIIDYYRLPARRVISKVLRNYLDHNGFSALELLFDRTEMTLLERNESLFPKLIQQVSTAQAKELSVKPTERAEILYDAAAQINEKSLDYLDEEDGFSILKKHGVDALIKQAKTKGTDTDAFLLIRHAFAVLLGDGGDWNSKIGLIVDLGKGELSDEGLDCIDEVLAELLDGSAAVGELLGGQPDAFKANRAMLHLSEGRYQAPPNPISCIVEFNDLMARHVLPQTRSVLYQRIASYLAGTRNLTREGPKAERESFAHLVRDLVEISGLKGGAIVCESVTLRARIALSDGDDLSFAEAITKITSMLPNRASRMGYLLELFQSDHGKRNGNVVLATLGRTIERTTSIASLVPEGSSEKVISDAMEGLKRKMSSEGLPEEWRKALSDTFDSLMSKPQTGNRAKTKVSLQEKEFREMIKKAPERKEITEGQVLFDEGDSGAEAYLILSGHVEIYRKIGNREEVIATVGRGGIIGEMSLIDNQPRMASARVLEGGQVSIIDENNFVARLENLNNSDKVLRRLIDVLVNRIRGEGNSYT